MKDYRTRSLLREWISFLLEEAGDEGELALWCQNIAGDNYYMVYKPGVFYGAIINDFHDAVEKGLKEEKNNFNHVNPYDIFQYHVITTGMVMKAVKGIMVCEKDRSGIAIVNQSAAGSRLGQAMYGLACSVEGKIMPSRSSISYAASDFWKRQYNDYGKPLPDGVRKFNREGMPWLDCYYTGIPSPWTADSLKRSHKDVLSRLVRLINDDLEEFNYPSNIRVNEGDLDKKFETALNSYFQERYKEVKHKKIENF